MFCLIYGALKILNGNSFQDLSELAYMLCVFDSSSEPGHFYNHYLNDENLANILHLCLCFSNFVSYFK